MRIGVLLWFFCSLAGAACPPEGQGAADLELLRASGFVVTDSQARNILALELVDCLGAPDPGLRDGIGFEALASWLRADALTVATRQRLFDELMQILLDNAPDADGFRRPFAALVLSEVVRTDRMAAWLSDEQRSAVVAAASAYLESISDYRGFDDREGWRHGVAHTADLMLQLVANPAVPDAQVRRMLAVIAGQIAPPGEHFYIFGEPERLARPVLYAALREWPEHDGVLNWLDRISVSDPLPDWESAYKSRTGLARRHNLRAFLAAIYLAAREADDAKMAALAPKALEKLRAMQ